MTISLSNNAARQSYAVSQGVTQSVFTVGFAFFDDDNLNVFVDGTLKTLTTHYTVSGGDGSTGTVTMTSGNFVTGISGGSTVIITRDIDLDRTTDFPSSGPFAVSTLNTELDKITAQFADRKDVIDRSIRLQDQDETQSMELPLKADRLGKVLGFNASTGAVEAGPTIADTQSLSAVSADIASLADIEDGTTATDAISGLAAIKANVTTVAGVSSNVTTVAGISSNVTSVAGNATNINTVAGISSEITSVAAKASLITSDFVSDLNTLAVTDVINDINTLATSDIVSDLNTLATSDIVSDLNTLATSDIVTDLNLLATSDFVSDLNTLGTSDVVSDLNTLAAISSDITSLAGALEKTYTVTVVNPGSGNVFVLDGSNNPTISIFRGNTYIFDQSDSSNAGHPIAFKDSGGSAYTTGVTSAGTPGSSGAKTTFVVPSDAPSSLRYYCTVHGNSMGNTISVTDSNISLVAGSIANVNLTGGSITNVNTVAAAVANVNTVATNLSGVNSFAERYRVASSDPTSSLDEGDLAYNTTDNNLKFYNGSSWVSVGGAISNIVEDTSPQLGGNLDTNSHNILIDDAHFIADENGNEQIIFKTTSSAVNQIDITNAATGNPPSISATGDDTNIGLTLTPKGSGAVVIDGLSHPTSDGSAGQFLKTDGSGALSFSTVTTDLSGDSSPQLGGNLDLNSNNITGTGNIATTGTLTLTSTDAITLPKGTTAQRPSGAEGMFRFNTTLADLEFYDGSAWRVVGVQPTVSAVSGDITEGVASNLTITMTNETDTVTVRFKEGSTLVADVADQAVSSGSLTVAVPAAVYGQTAGDTISISILNQDGTASTNSIDKTVLALPSGGTIVTSGGYRFHTFLSSGTFVIPAERSVEALIIAGGGSGGHDSGGGGAGGAFTETKTLTAGNYTVTVGAASSDSSVTGNVNYTTAVGGGNGGGYQSNGSSGGSGGGGGVSSGSGGAGTSGQGNSGGDSGGNYASGGGGGKGGAGTNGSDPNGGNGGAGSNFGGASNWATPTSTGDNGYYASGGGGGKDDGGGGGTASDGGGGPGYERVHATGLSKVDGTNANGQANTGGGAGGSGGTNSGQPGNTGGSGIVIFKYAV